jgi:hypothetical protein
MGFLSNLLPMVAGGALAATGVGAPAAAAMIGGLQAARTGSLQKGLMAGIGAYGGAGLAGGLGASAATTVPEGAQMAAAAGDSTAGINAMGGMDKMTAGVQGLGSQAGRDAFMTKVGGGSGLLKTGLAATAPMMGEQNQPQMPVGDSTMPQRLKYDRGTATPFPMPDVPGYDNLGQDFGRQRSYFPNAGYQQITPEEAKSIRGYAAGGYMGGGPVEQMSNENAVGMNTGYPQADITGHAYATPWQTPVSQNVVAGTADTGVNRMTGQMLAEGGAVEPTPDFQEPYTAMARGGLSDLGSYSDGGRLLRGPGDGVSDSIPAVIGKKKPARLADGEFVVPARIVSELGNGSTEAGARKLYAMLDRVQSARKKSIGKGKVAKDSRADKLLPA